MLCGEALNQPEKASSGAGLVAGSATRGAGLVAGVMGREASPVTGVPRLWRRHRRSKTALPD
jgi:hypothetical protein